MRSRRWVLVMLLGVLAILVVMIGWLLARSRAVTRRESGRSQLSTTPFPYVISTPTKMAVNSPVVKRVNSGGESAAYIVHGSFIAPLEQQSNLLIGQFVVRDDPNKRVIPIMMGSAGREVQLRTYQGSFAGDSQWLMSSLNEAAREIPINTEVELRFNLTLNSSDRSFETHQKLENRWDWLITEFAINQFTKVAPDMSWLVVPAVGWVGGR